MNVMSNWLAFALLGSGMVRSANYPRWLGWPGLSLGIIGVLMGMAMAFVGREAIFHLFTVLGFATILWLLLCGLWVARKVWWGQALDR
jgi:hypothetical protein